LQKGKNKNNTKVTTSVKNVNNTRFQWWIGMVHEQHKVLVMIKKMHEQQVSAHHINNNV
jgi:hypothetical protein